MNTLHRHLLTAVAVASLAACSSVKLDDQAPVESRSGAAVVPGNQNAARDAAANSQTRVAPVDATSGDMAGMGNIPRIVYFDFDSFVVKDEYRPVVESNAKMLSADRKKRMTLEGHTDERGGREYNLALGQKRAEAVQKSMLLVGATEGQLEAVSYGEERPAAQGSDEAAWAKNRRAELKDR